MDARELQDRADNLDEAIVSGRMTDAEVKADLHHFEIMEVPEELGDLRHRLAQALRETMSWRKGSGEHGHEHGSSEEGEVARVALVMAYDAAGRLLLGRRHDTGAWTLPGGHVEPGEVPEDAARRELKEEAGLDAFSLSPLHGVRQPAGEGRPVLHVFTCLVGMHAAPHGHLDPDREAAEWRFVPCADGLPGEVWDNLQGPPGQDNVIRQVLTRQADEDEEDEPGDAVKAEGDENADADADDLEKTQPTPTFPGLGLPDDRRETPLVQGRAWRSKMRAFAALQARANPHLLDYQERVRADQKDLHGNAGMASGTSGVHMSYAVTDKTRERAQPQGYSVSPSIYLDPMSSTATQLHENWHQMMLRVQEKYGRAARKAVARHLVESLPLGHLSEVQMLGHTMHPRARAGDHEEQVAVLHNYLNSPGYRAEYHHRLEIDPTTPEGEKRAREVQGHLKAAHQHVRRAAAALTPEHVQALPREGLPSDWRPVREDAEKAEGEGEDCPLDKAERVFVGGDCYAAYGFPTEDEAKAFQKRYRDKHEDEWKGTGVSVLQGKRVMVRAWDWGNQQKAHRLAVRMGGEVGDLSREDVEAYLEGLGKAEDEDLVKADTPEFQQWFEGSHVKDRYGAPLRVYHGTSKDKDFHTFKIGQRGAWFTSDPNEANSYAETNDSQGHTYDTQLRSYVPKNVTPRVIPAYLSLKNPYHMTLEDHQAMNVEGYRHPQGTFFNALRAKGHDGVILPDGKTFVAFHPHQIKSVFNARPTATSGHLSRSEVEDLGKVELLHHHDPRERALAAATQPLSFRDVLRAALDEHPDVRAAALARPEVSAHHLRLLCVARRLRDGRPPGNVVADYLTHPAARPDHAASALGAAEARGDHAAEMVAKEHLTRYGK